VFERWLMLQTLGLLVKIEPRFERGLCGVECMGLEIRR